MERPQKLVWRALSRRMANGEHVMRCNYAARSSPQSCILLQPFDGKKQIRSRNRHQSSTGLSVWASCKSADNKAFPFKRCKPFDLLWVYSAPKYLIQRNFIWCWENLHTVPLVIPPFSSFKTWRGKFTLPHNIMLPLGTYQHFCCALLALAVSFWHRQPPRRTAGSRVLHMSNTHH